MLISSFRVHGAVFLLALRVISRVTQQFSSLLERSGHERAICRDGIYEFTA